MVKEDLQAFLFVGDDDLSKEKAIEDIKSSLLRGDSAELDLKVFRGEETCAREVISDAATMPFLAARRLIIVRGFDRLRKEERTRVFGNLVRLPASACLILEARDEDVIKESSETGGRLAVRRFRTGERIEDGSLAGEVLKPLGKSVSPEALETISQNCPHNASIVARELEKLAAYTGDRAVITAEDAEALLGKTLAASAFDLADAIGDNDVERAVGIASDLVRSGTKPFEVIGVLCWHLKRMLRAKTLATKGESNYHIARILRIRQADRERFFRQSAIYDREDIESRLEMLLETDFQIKRSRYDAALILQFAVMRLCLA